MGLTPNDLEILIHHFVSPEEHPRSYAPAVQEAITHFILKGVFEKLDSGRIVTTSKGQAWLKMILAVPEPKRAWVNPETKEFIKFDVSETLAESVSHFLNEENPT